MLLPAAGSKEPLKLLFLHLETILNAVLWVLGEGCLKTIIRRVCPLRATIQFIGLCKAVIGPFWLLQAIVTVVTWVVP